MSGTKLGGLKAAAKNLAKDPLFYEKIGAKGGQSGAGEDYQKGGISACGFAANPQLARIAGAKGGRISRRKKRVENEIYEIEIPPKENVITRFWAWKKS